ncbi:YajQ family cyclic di-GMP-binding protein [Candidatus Saccharibacteria bacterium]|nr:YajQ family cyclic di-GMP-binding protein [Candidatus Saccharibacteria bacterium]
MAQFSFDIISSYDKAEINNVFLQAQKEIASRYDFRGTAAGIEWLADKKGIKVIADSAWQVEQVIDLVRKKLAARNQSSKVLNLDSEVHEGNMRAWQDISFKDGLKQDDAKTITKLLKEKHPKLKSQIQGDEVRVTGASKDDLQAAMQTLRDQDFEFPLIFTNYR